MEEEQLQKQHKLANPSPECDEPAWKANTEKCSGCTTRFYYLDNVMIKRGCEYCDEHWDCPDLIH